MGILYLIQYIVWTLFQCIVGFPECSGYRSCPKALVPHSTSHFDDIFKVQACWAKGIIFEKAVLNMLRYPDDIWYCGFPFIVYKQRFISPSLSGELLCVISVCVSLQSVPKEVKQEVIGNQPCSTPAWCVWRFPLPLTLGTKIRMLVKVE